MKFFHNVTRKNGGQEKKTQKKRCPNGTRKNKKMVNTYLKNLIKQCKMSI